MRSEHRMPFGARRGRDGSAHFRLWAPAQPRVVLEIFAAREGGGGADPASRQGSRRADGATDPTAHAMQPAGAGWHELVLEDPGPGALYRYRLADGLAVPDPASRFNPCDVHGPSALTDPLAYRWGDRDWRGRPWHEAVIYELHVGAFTPQGSFAAARERLADLAALGVSAVELMPVADFPGARNWGYDGVLPFAPDASYGTPDELKALVDRAHALGLMVLLDVVCNHFGPEGNYLHAYAPQFFDASRRTPWGAAIDFDGPASRTVRDFFVHNALYWVEEFHFDGLRLDAVHAIDDRSTPHIVEEIARALHDGPGRRRQVHLVLENDRNESRRLAPAAIAAAGAANAQWNDDVHHALHVLVTGECDGYYADYAERPLAKLGRGLAEGFVYQGDASAFRGDAPRGEHSAHLAPQCFVNFLQSHDQVGNRAFGERLDALADASLMPAALACLLLAPSVPMLFMGEEWAASTPFLFFCDFGPELAAAVARGRRGEFARFRAFRDPAVRERIPDPNAPHSLEASRLQWSERGRSPHREREALVRELLAIRRRRLTTRLAGMRGGGRFSVDGGLLSLRWTLGDGSALTQLANFGRGDAAIDGAAPGERLFEHGVVRDREGGARLARGGIRVALGEARDG